MKTVAHGLQITIASADAVGVADRWELQYKDTEDPAKRKITKKLLAFGRAPSADAVASIIGNKSWTHPSCGVCKKDVEVALVVGDYETQNVCADCMQLALKVMGKEIV